ncbi:proton-coupled zinc antiporter SLC30A2-like [Oscarella lobularis]|uniref:proton-coupled zinc antiporter SLC30A2-like n=1 Tax=Oscarella lobularis TaxID=121494 RepID=UPI003313A057
MSKSTRESRRATEREPLLAKSTSRRLGEGESRTARGFAHSSVSESGAESLTESLEMGNRQCCVETQRPRQGSDNDGITVTSVNLECTCHARETPDRAENFDRRAHRKLLIAILLCGLFMIAELVGGFLSHSLAIMMDAAHMLSDLASYSISLFSMWVARQKPTKRMSFGFHRAEVVGAVVSILIIWVLTGILVYEGIQRIIHGDTNVDADIMLIIAGTGVGINIIMGFVLKPPHSHSHSHSHGDGDHGNHDNHAHKPENLNVRAAFVHAIGDIFSSIGVLIAAYIIRFKPSWSIADPICTFIFSVIVLFTTLTVIRDALHVLMEGVPRQLSFDAIQEDLQNVYGVQAVHDMHIWALTTDKIALSVHLAIDRAFDAQDVLLAAKEMLVRKHKVFKITVQIETYQEKMKECVGCQGP